MLCLSGFELYFRWVPLFGHSLIAVVFVLAKPPKYSLRNNICQFNHSCLFFSPFREQLYVRCVFDLKKPVLPR